MSLVRLVIGLCLLCISGCVLTGQGSVRDTRAGEETIHGLWITRWDYQKPEHVRQAIDDAASIGITDVYWQVRGQADAYYPSSYEPWGIELTKYNPDPPSFDPLQIAINQSKKHNIKIHAWVNVMPMWRGKVPPADRTHMYHSHPEWRLRDENGQVQQLHDGYVVVNPVLTEVQDHIVQVIRELVDRYEIDGIHLDYIRYLSDEIKTEHLIPGDPVSRSLYAKQTGGSALASEIDRIKYKNWIRDRITTLVERIDRESIKRHRNVTLSAAVWRRPDLASQRYLQDAADWANDGTVDVILPMIYTEKHDQYKSDLAAWNAVVKQSDIVPGLGVYKHTLPSETSHQIALGQPKRFALFAYSTLFESPNPDQPKDPASIALRTKHRDSMRDLITRVGDTGG
ncbi:MAG: glycoside hydrolase family 10 protein [Phycisphaerales bacterium]